MISQSIHILKPAALKIAIPIQCALPLRWTTHTPAEIIIRKPVVQKIEALELVQKSESTSIPLGTSVLVNSGSVKNLGTPRGRSERFRHFHIPWKIHDAAHVPVELFLPLPAADIPVLTESMLKVIQKKYPLLKTAQIVPLKFFPSIPRHRIAQLKVVSGTLSAKVRLPCGPTRDESYYDLLFFLDTSTRKTLTVEFPHRKIRT